MHNLVDNSNNQSNPNIYISIAYYIVTMATTIQISNELLEQLKQMKMHEKESYEEIIWDMVEDRMELSKETKQEIKDYEERVSNGTFSGTSLEDVKKELGINV